MNRRETARRHARELDTREPTQPGHISITATAAPTTIAHRQSASRSVAFVALIAGVAAELVAGAARAIDIPMRAGPIGASTAVTLPPGLVGLEAAIGVVAGAVLVGTASKRSSRPRRNFLRFTIALTGLSLISPIAAGATQTATKVVLVSIHVVVALIAIPMLARTLPTERSPHDRTTTAPTSDASKPSIEHRPALRGLDRRSTS